MPMSPRLLRPRQAGGFTPRSLSGLAGWWDANDTSTITLNGSTVSEWRDKSGASRHMSQGTAANQPSYVSSDLGGRATVRLAASTNNRLNTSGVYMDVLGNDTSQLITIFAVLKSTNATLDQKTIGECDNASGFGWYHRFSSPTNSFFDAGNAGTARAGGSASQAAFQNGAIYVGRRSSGNVDQWVNNTLIAGSITNASGSLRTAGNNVFCIRGSGGTLSYAEIVIYNRALTTDERSSVQRYLGSKWSIALA